DDMQLQARVAIEEADIILFVVDARIDLGEGDYEAAELLRKKAGSKPVFLVANKCDNHLEDSELAEFYRLGLGEPHQVSAMHRTGLDMMLGKIIEQLRLQHFIMKDDPMHKVDLKRSGKHRNIAMVGRPNVGKSSLINALLNKEKLIVSDIPGTTRDSTDSLISHKEKQYNFIDTAGLKRPGKTQMGIEKFSSLRSMASIERSDIALLVIDTSEPISHQDQQIANYILKAGKGLVILANKWDLKSEDDAEEEKKRRLNYIARLKKKFPFLPWAPVIFTSAITKKNLHHIFDQIEVILKERKKRITTAKLNTFVRQLIEEHAPTGKTQFKPKIYYITQPEIEPPKFIIFVNKKSAFHFSYLRYIENRIREKFEFTGTAVKLEYREKPKRD
ncbi:ribosome biogenesis GTPase Der, partial [Patescibacteria group bacterium]|nr:ribosome biogenesis GTPase Der [Patescibacteria group bacterium]